MKKKIFMGIFALALLATAGYGVQKSMKSNVNLSGLALSNVEALAGGESGGGVLQRNFKSGTVWYKDGANVEIGVTSEPGIWASWGVTWKTITCCLMGTDMDGCDFSKEDGLCAQKAPRPQHNS